ncbi:Actin-related protein 2/3 complex subunit 5 [Amphibalanus amphitrite]|uniref:Actin-related protein 2/3 complex subunit 5 n=1 Tax=Amphibalanus amphitrite TaxID=1232801 RepID=A0A6A4UW79_AMPAM|nr:Actin-related protein 2/3 complex subunit 5 [Amphibalanus amphitrite]
MTQPVITAYLTMAKNTANHAFRKIDVDQYNEDLYREEEAGDAASTGPDEAQLQQLLSAGKNTDALQYVLQQAPAGSRSQAAKDAALQAVMRVLTAFRTADMEAAVRSLSPRPVRPAHESLLINWRRSRRSADPGSRSALCLQDWSWGRGRLLHGWP